MEEFNFDNLKNIDVPQNWIENALNSPEEKRKFVIPKRFYYFTASLAACVIIGAAVIFSLMIGINKNVDLIDPNPEASAKAGFAVEETTETQSVTLLTSPSKKNGEGAVSSTAETEHSENITAPKQKTSAPKKQNDNENKKAPQSSEPGSNTKVKPGESEKTEARTDVPETEAQETQKPAPKPTDSHQGEASLEFYFMANVESEVAAGSVYCRIEDENGTISKGMAIKYEYDEEDYFETRLTYIKYLKLTVGKSYTVVFYNNQGTVIAQGTVIIGDSSDYWI